ncbi:hypothetical protein Tco_0622867 [Tanacetum coccineum]
MIDCLSIVETDKVIHTVETDIVKLVVEIESFGMSSDEFDKKTRSSDSSLHEKLNSFPKFLGDSMIANKCIDLWWPDEWTIFNGSRIIRPCCLFIMYSSIMLSMNHTYLFPTLVDDCQHPKESLCQQESSLRN